MTTKKIGLALSGGGARGFAHVGALKVFEEHGVRFDMIAGTSAGSIVGGALAAGMSAAEIAAMAAKVRHSNMMLPALSARGMFSSAPMGKFFARHFPVTRFERLSTPFAAVAFNLGSSSQVVCAENGDLIKAIRASCAVPGVFVPVRDASGRMLVDGGVMSPLPVDVVRAMGADIVVAIDLIGCGSTFRNAPRTGLGIMIQSMMTTLQVVTRNAAQNADITIAPQIAHLRPDQISKRDELIQLGEQAAREQIDAILELIS